MTGVSCYTLADVLAWAHAAGEPYAAVCELLKVPARLGMIDDDIGVIPADLAYFENKIAPSGYAAVSKARDLKAARQRSNARVRALINRFLLAQSTDGAADKGKARWDQLIDFVQQREGFKPSGLPFANGTSRGLMMLRARIHVAPRDVDDVVVNRIAAQLSAEKRKSLRRALKTLNRLITDFGDYSALAGVLPKTPLQMPVPVSTRERIRWSSLPTAFRSNAEGVMRSALSQPVDLLEEARRRMDAGAEAAEVLNELDVAAAGRKRVPLNPEAAMANWRSAVTWLVLASEKHAQKRDGLKTLAALFTSDILETACTDQIARSAGSAYLKDPKKTQTLKGRLTALETLAKHGLKRPDLVAIVELQKRFHDEYLRNVGRTMTDDVRSLCDALTHKPASAANFINAPKNIAARALAQIQQAKDDKNILKEISGLRLYMTAVLFAAQVSRPLRSSNLIRLRHRSTQANSGHLTWIRKRAHAELRFARGEIKNDREVSMHVHGDEANILWVWLNDLRPRYLALRDLPDSPYVLPGSATPRLLKAGLSLPKGCICPSTLSEIWRDGAEIIGLDLKPHQARHAVATLILAVEPGNFAKAASVLGDTEDTVRRHYGRDSGAAAAQQVRAALKSQHPDIFKKMKGRMG